MVKGLENTRRNMTLLLNKISNDIASSIAQKINSAEPGFGAKAEKRTGDETTVSAVVKGRAELAKSKEAKVDQIIGTAIKTTLGD